MLKSTVSAQGHRQLEDMFNTTERRLRTRCQAILMAHRRRPHCHIAEDLGVTVRTLPRWLRAYQAKRLAGRQLRWRPGRSARIPAALAPEILGWILQGPARCGLDRAHWTSAALASQRDRTHGIAVRASPMRAFGPNHGVRPYRPTSHDLKAAPAQQMQAHQDLQALKKRPKREHSSCAVTMKRAFR